MIVTDKSWFVVRNTPNVTGFVGSGTVPVPVSAEEFKIVKRRMGEQAQQFKIDFSEGENVLSVEVQDLAKNITRLLRTVYFKPT